MDERGGAQDGIEEQDGGISMLRNIFFQTRGMRGELENEVGDMKVAGYN